LEEGSGHRRVDGHGRVRAHRAPGRERLDEVGHGRVAPQRPRRSADLDRNEPAVDACLAELLGECGVGTTQAERRPERNQRHVRCRHRRKLTSERVAADDFLSGESGHVAGIRAVTRTTLRDRALDLRLALGSAGRAARAASGPPRSVLVAGIYGPRVERMSEAVEELRRSHHDVEIVLGARQATAPELAGLTAADHLAGGKFENLNALLEGREPAKRDWLLVVDDDVALPHRFLDRFLAICGALGFALAQPAQTWRSHAAWRVTRRRGGVIARETRYVEIGPVTAFRADALAELFPFPPLRYGWGLDVHWSAVARDRGWKLGVVDALPVRHDWAPVAAGYPHDAAVAEAREFLRDRPYLPAEAAQETVAVHATLPR
jgi:hypothetical protein